MLKVQVKECKKCGKVFMDRSGGIVMHPEEVKNSNLCDECRAKSSKGKFKELLIKR